MYIIIMNSQNSIFFLSIAVAVSNIFIFLYFFIEQFKGSIILDLIA